MKLAITLVVALLACGALADCNLNPQPFPPGAASENGGPPAGTGGGSGSGSGGAGASSGSSGSPGPIVGQGSDSSVSLGGADGAAPPADAASEAFGSPIEGGTDAPTVGDAAGDAPNEADAPGDAPDEADARGGMDATPDAAIETSE